MGNELKLLPCPFCNRPCVQTQTCGLAKPDCPRCADTFGCAYCDVWFDTANEWNTRPDHTAALVKARDLLKPIIDQVIKVVAESPNNSCGWQRVEDGFGGFNAYPLRDEVVETLQKVKAEIEAAIGQTEVKENG